MVVSETPRDDQESFKDAPKSSKLTIYRACGVLASCQGAAGSPQRGPEELLESQNEFQSSAEELYRGPEELRQLA